MRRLELMMRAARGWQARRALRQASARSQQIRDEYTLLGAELLQALRAEADAKYRMSQLNLKK